jgi:hypothetical protein
MRIIKSTFVAAALAVGALAATSMATIAPAEARGFGGHFGGHFGHFGGHFGHFGGHRFGGFGRHFAWGHHHWGWHHRWGGWGYGGYAGGGDDDSYCYFKRWYDEDGYLHVRKFCD